MSDSKKTFRPKARVAKGFRDIDAAEIRGTAPCCPPSSGSMKAMVSSLSNSLHRIHRSLGKFLHDQDRPNAGVFSFQDDDDQWLSLRYDLTAPSRAMWPKTTKASCQPPTAATARAGSSATKSGPRRFRQFMQFDADTVGSANPAADAEVCMMAADTMEALGIPLWAVCCKGKSSQAD